MVPDPDPVLRTSSAAKGGRLHSWKEIARHLHRGVTTVQRWERDEGLPVHRHVHGSGGSVFAYLDELDGWLSSREPGALRVVDRSMSATPAISPISSISSISSGTAGRSEVPGGAMPLESPYYIRRAADDECRQAIARRSAIVFIKGARRVGKTSLLARALAGARQSHAAVAFTDMQALGLDDLRSAKTLYQALGRRIADQIASSPSILNMWDNHDSPNTNFSRYLRRILSSVQRHVVWGLDEVDRIAGFDYASDVFGLFRSWHNLRALDPAGHWDRLTLVLACATDPRLPIGGVDEPPFDVGVRAVLDDFGCDEVTSLNERHGSLLDVPAGVRRLLRFVGGQPYQVQCAFDALKRGASLESLERGAVNRPAPSSPPQHRIRVDLRRTSRR